MSVYTPVDAAQLQPFLRHYQLGELIAFSGIENGIENTNYRIHTDLGHFILTLFEAADDAQITPIFTLLEHLHAHDLPVPRPQQDRFGRHLNRLAHKSAGLFNQLPGKSLLQPESKHCFEIGRYLARLHLATGHVTLRRRTPNNLQGLRRLYNACKPYLNRRESNSVSTELAFQQHYDTVALPQGLIHGDLFRDNALFVDDRVSAILDFYGCCNDVLLLDIAIAINDWCRHNGSFCRHKVASVLTGYQSIRPLQAAEKKLLPVFLRRAALRFWLSRLQHQADARSASLTQVKDPEEYRRILKHHCMHSQSAAITP